MTLRIAFVLAAAACLALFAPLPCQAQFTPEKLLEGMVEQLGPEKAELAAAIEKFAAGDTQGALEQLQAARQKSPALPPADTLLAQLALAANQLPLARAALERAAATTPDDPGAFVLLGALALRDGRATEAGLCFQTAARLCDRYRDNPLRKKLLETQAAEGMVAVAEARGDWAEVSRLTTIAAKAAPDDLRLQMRLARAQFLLDKKEEAADLLQRAYQTARRLKDSQALRPEINLALLYEERAGRETDSAQKQALRAEARRLMAQAVKEDGANVRTQLAVARWALEGGDYAVARRCGEAALKLDEQNFEARWYLGVAAQAQRDLTTAETMFRAAFLQSPSDAQLINQLALVLAAQADPAKRQQAIDLAETNARRFANQRDALARNAAVTLAWTLHQAGKSAEAEQLLGPVLAAGGLSLDSMYLAAQIYHDRGKLAVARRILEPAVRGGAPLLFRDEAVRLWGLVKDATDAPPQP